MVVSSTLHGNSDGSNFNVHADVKPGAGGVITKPNENDVLSGRGGRINSHPGNVAFRELVNKHKHQYLSRETKKLEKVKVADLIVQTIRKMDPPGRFLKEDSSSGGWLEIGDERARKKAGQAMREKADSTRQELEQKNVEAPSAYAGYEAPMFHNAATMNPIQEQNIIPMNTPSVIALNMYQQQMQLQMQMQQHFSTDSTDSSHIPFGQPGYPQPSSAVGFMQNGTPLLYDEKEHQSNSMSISSLSGMPPPLNQNSLYQSYQISSLPESKRQQMKRHVEPLNGNIHPVGSLNRMKSSDTSVSAMSSFFGSDNSSMFSQEQLLSLNEQQSLSMQGMPIEALRDDLQRNNSHDQTGSTQDRRRMFRQNFSQQSTFNLPLAKDDQDTSGTSTSDLMRESLLSFNQSGPIQSPSYDRRFSTGDMTMSEFSLNRILETAGGNSASFLSFGTVGMPSESRFQLGSNIIPTIDISNQPGPESYPQNTVTSNAREVYFNSDVNFESKRGLQEDASMISQSRRSSVSTWLGEVEKFPGLRTIDMGSFRNDAGGSRLRLFSGQSYANESMRSIMSDLSENISALDLAHEHGFPQRRRSSQSTHIFQMT
jgi:hypothetical protein